jgi:protein CpxP
MTRTHFSFKRIVLASGLASLAAVALAQTPATAPVVPEPPARHAHDHARHDPAQRQAQREARLKEALQLTAEQEPAWNQYTASLLRPAPKAERPDPNAMRALTTPQRIERMRALQAERAAEMDRRADATLRLYAALTPQQQATFDQRSAMGLQHGPKHGHKHHRHAAPHGEHKS